MANKAIRFGGKTAAQIVKEYTNDKCPSWYYETRESWAMWECFRMKMCEHVDMEHQPRITDKAGTSHLASKKLKEIGATLSKGMASLCHKMDKAEISECERSYYYPETTFDGYTLKGGVTILFEYRRGKSCGYKCFFINVLRRHETISVSIDEKHGEKVSQNFIAAVRDWQENFEEYMRAIEDAIEAHNKEIKKAKVEATTRHAVIKVKMKQEGWAFETSEESEKETILRISIGDNGYTSYLSIKLEHKDFVNQLDKAVERIRPVLNALKNIDDILIGVGSSKYRDWEKTVEYFVHFV